jgi:succinyl-CoA synthetase (ADP-forming) beta subunit (EC 6.2.1.5)
MRLQEHQAKTLFAEAGIPVPPSTLVESVAGAVAAAEELGLPVAVKAQVRVGGRGLAGGVELAADLETVEAAAARILGMNLKGHDVASVLIESAVDADAELYLGITVDREAGQPVAMVSDAGGTSIETVAAEQPDAVVREPIDPAFGLHEYQARRAVFAAGVDRQASAVSDSLGTLYELWAAHDGLAAEINPLVLTSDGVVAVDAVLSVDDNARWRQPDLAEYAPSPSPTDSVAAQAATHDFDYVQLDGDVGVIGNGAGLVMATLDQIDDRGGSPANFLDIGGGAGPERVKNALKMLFEDETVEAILFNVFGGITRCDEVARGVNDALSALDNVTKPTIVRLAGTNAAAGRALLDPTVYVADSFGDAVATAVAAADKTGASSGSLDPDTIPDPDPDRESRSDSRPSLGPESEVSE